MCTSAIHTAGVTATGIKWNPDGRSSGCNAPAALFHSKIGTELLVPRHRTEMFCGPFRKLDISSTITFSAGRVNPADIV
jgi:hypothetical protein